VKKNVSEQQDRLQLITEIRDSVDVLQSTEFAAFLSHLIPLLHKLLFESPPAFHEGTEQSIRKIAFEVLQRVPRFEHFPSNFFFFEAKNLFVFFYNLFIDRTVFSHHP
jgi:hypothetical protein